MPEVSYTNLSAIESALNSISRNVGTVNSTVELLSDHQQAMAYKQATMESDLKQLMQTFAAFVAQDSKHKNLQLAETRVGNLRQELQIKFGYYAEIRRMATGILQAAESGVVGNETIKVTTEEVMIKAPGYWLAPALVALVSWIRDDKMTCEKALNECLKRDDYKSTLFFMLLSRRLGRNEASLNWLERYFIHQNPQDLDREFITVLEAVTTGVFQPASRNIMMKHVKNWLNHLTKGDQFINEQKNQWIKFFEALKPSVESEKYPLLKKYATNWVAIENSLRNAYTQEIMHKHFYSVIASSYDFSLSIITKLDEILTQLVTNFDDEELPLQKQVRLNQLIIEKDGDKDDAQSVIDAEENIFKEKVDFLQMLTNAAFNPESTGVTKVTQALAVSISQPWIIEAHDTFTAESRSKFPQTIELLIDGFATSTKNGSDEKQIILEQDKFYSSKLEKTLSAITFPIGSILIGCLMILGGLWAVISGIQIGIIIIGIGSIIVWNNANSVKKQKDQVKIASEARKKNSKEVLRGCMAEAVDYRKELSNEDIKAENVHQILKAITPQDFSSVSQETARSII